jgi:hypothetical protein
MKVVVAQTYKEFCDAGRGAISPAFRGAGDSRVLTHYIRRCPGCDRESAIPINDASGEDYGFSVAGNPFDIASLTLTGILHCPQCDWRGYIQNGEYIESPL